jgi:hypothetical protein
LLLQASKDYNVGEAPDARAVEVAQELGLQLREGAVARVFDCTSDIVLFDLLLVMDKVSQACFSLSLFICCCLLAPHCCCFPGENTYRFLCPVPIFFLLQCSKRDWEKKVEDLYLLSSAVQCIRCFERSHSL